jgi:diguanylate cyclase (GGDEF)-like protein
MAASMAARSGFRQRNLASGSSLRDGVIVGERAYRLVNLYGASSETASSVRKSRFWPPFALHGLVACLSFLMGRGVDIHERLGNGSPSWLLVSALVLALVTLAAAVDTRSPRRRRAEPARVPEAPSGGEGVRRDALTGLVSRAAFMGRLSRILEGSRRGDRAGALLCVDLIGFRKVNETIGPAAGDLLLRHTSARLLAALRETDVLARMEADEFAIIQTGIAGPDAVASLCERLVEIMQEPFDLHGQARRIGISIGVAVFPQDGRDPDTLLARARLALDEVKASDGSAFRFFRGEAKQGLRQDGNLEHDLRYALERDQFELQYQPQIDIVSRRMVGVEALLRWLHPERGRINPDTFIPVAEDSGHIIPIGAWVLEQACAQAVRWHEAGAHDLRMSVNLSPVQFRHPDLTALVSNVLSRTGLAPACLELEITERVLMENTQANLSTLECLRGLGVRISLDDFGVGHSCLGYLQRFCFDEIKVDRSFVDGLERDRSAAAIVRATLALGRSLGMRAVAEGVETAEQLALLREEGCTLAQGFFFSPPMTVREIDAMVQAGAEAAEQKGGSTYKVAIGEL